jgi:hypothetical protein
MIGAGTQFTCFTGTKVQILTLQLVPQARMEANDNIVYLEVLSLLALLVQKYKY